MYDIHKTDERNLLKVIIFLISFVILESTYRGIIIFPSNYSLLYIFVPRRAWDYFSRYTNFQIRQVNEIFIESEPDIISYFR